MARFDFFGRMTAEFGCCNMTSGYTSVIEDEYFKMLRDIKSRCYGVKSYLFLNCRRSVIQTWRQMAQKNASYEGAVTKRSRFAFYIQKTSEPQCEPSKDVAI